LEKYYRVPAVIDELAKRIDQYEKNGSSAMTQHIRYGYFFDLDARHYDEGYPVVCKFHTIKIKRSLIADLRDKANIFSISRAIGFMC
jgi:hypothetical protein